MKYTFYRIVKNDDDDFCYIGSTKNFINRKYQHKNNTNNVNCRAYTYKLYQHIRDNGGWEQFNMIPIEEGEYENTISCRIREEQLRKENNGNLNSLKAHVIQKEAKREYYENNKDIINQKKKIYYEANKKYISNQKKEYRKANFEDIKQHKKEYYEANKDKIQQYRKQKIICECGGHYTINHKQRHLETKKHLDYIN
jgi:ribosomal protein S27AE